MSTGACATSNIKTVSYCFNVFCCFFYPTYGEENYMKIKCVPMCLQEDFWSMCAQKQNPGPHSLMYSLHQSVSLLGPQASSVFMKHINMRWIRLHARASPSARTTSMWQNGSTQKHEQVINPCQVLLKPSQTKQNISYWAVIPKEALYKRGGALSCLLCSPAASYCLFTDVIKVGVEKE